ncbi:MAG: carbon monoxide dehydrogenase subunit G [Chloroflexota bacterium]
MKLDGVYTFHAPRQLVWETVLDPEALRRCIPGLETFEPAGQDEYAATMKIGVGSIKGSYSAKIRIFDLREPEHYKLSVEAKGTPGFVRGEGSFNLRADDAETTTLRWEADAQIGGAVAAVGQRMLGGVAKMTIGQLWVALDAQVKARQAGG